MANRAAHSGAETRRPVRARNAGGDRAAGGKEKGKGLEPWEQAAVRGPFRQRNILLALNDRAREALLRHCEFQRFRVGENLYAEGSRHRATYLIKNGLVRAYHTSSIGRELTIGYWGAGDLIGGPHFFDDTRLHIWSARAAEDTEVFAITGRDLKSLTLRIPEIGEAVLDAICFKCLWDSLLMQVLGTRSVTARLADLLVKLATLHGERSLEGLVISRRFTQDDLANMVGATRQWVNAKLLELERVGTVKVQENKLVVCDLDRLKALGK